MYIHHHLTSQLTHPTHPVNRAVIMKLLAFTLAMIVVPIGSYFLTVDTLFGGAQLLPLSPFLNTQIHRHTCIPRPPFPIPKWTG